ncbi:bax inhibitor 1-like isoform X1 [Coffea arabica]|uniref:Bax inhibitor 1-like isoform X1 n=1 Tax=Coffea arabica TaxID=13443 RepID=A0ABM4X0H1_COFAR
MVIGLCIGVSLAPVVDLLGTIGEGKNTVFNGALNVGPLIGPLIAMDKAAAGLLKGAPDGSLINSLIPADERDVLLAISGAAAIFLCFGVVTKDRRDRLEMYVFGVTPSAAMLCAGSVTFQMNYKFLWLIGYVVAYSQEIVVRARRGDNYYTQHCVAFFLDIIPFTFHLGRITVSVCVCVHVSASTLLSNPLCLLP